MKRNLSYDWMIWLAKDDLLAKTVWMRIQQYIADAFRAEGKWHGTASEVKWRGGRDQADEQTRAKWWRTQWLCLNDRTPWKPKPCIFGVVARFLPHTIVLEGGGEVETPVRNLVDLFLANLLIKCKHEWNKLKHNYSVLPCYNGLQLFKQMNREQEATSINEQESHDHMLNH